MAIICAARCSKHLQCPVESVPVRTTFLEGEALNVQPQNGGALIHLATVLQASRIVLATGNESPSAAGRRRIAGPSRLDYNPWQSWENCLPDSGGTILVLGTGLTTVDAVITLRALGWQGVIHAVSRNGWLPAPHFRGIEYPDFPPVLMWTWLSSV